MASTTIRKILKELGEQKLGLYKGTGYFYFVYDDVDESDFYLDHSVSICHLNHMSHEDWIAEGRDFLTQVRAKLAYRSK